MPGKHSPCTPPLMKRYLSRLKIPTKLYLNWAAETDLSQFSQRNPNWPLRAWVGLLLETDWDEVKVVADGT